MIIRRLLTLLLSLSLTGVLAQNVVAETVWLDELPMNLSDCGYSSTKQNKSVDGNPLKIAGKVYDRGVGTHPPGAIYLQLDGGTSRFSALVGIDDEVGKAGSAEFLVVGDGKTLWKSDVKRGGEPPQKVDVDLRGVKQLELVVTVAGDGYGHDHTDWVEAKFEVTGKRPVATGAHGRSWETREMKPFPSSRHCGDRSPALAIACH